MPATSSLSLLPPPPDADPHAGPDATTPVAVGRRFGQPRVRWGPGVVHERYRPVRLALRQGAEAGAAEQGQGWPGCGRGCSRAGTRHSGQGLARHREAARDDGREHTGRAA